MEALNYSTHAYHQRDNRYDVVGGRVWIKDPRSLVGNALLPQGELLSQTDSLINLVLMIILGSRRIELTMELADESKTMRKYDTVTYEDGLDYMRLDLRNLSTAWVGKDGRINMTLMEGGNGTRTYSFNPLVANIMIVDTMSIEVMSRRMLDVKDMNPEYLLMMRRAINQDIKELEMRVTIGSNWGASVYKCVFDGTATIKEPPMMLGMVKCKTKSDVRTAARLVYGRLSVITQEPTNHRVIDLIVEADTLIDKGHEVFISQGTNIGAKPYDQMWMATSSADVKKILQLN